MAKTTSTLQEAWFKWIAASILAIALGFAGFMYGPQIIRIVTNHGEIVIDTKVDDVKIEVLR